MVRGVHVVVARGKTYAYAWRGGPRLIAEPGTDAFIAELARAREGRLAGPEGKTAGLCARYRASEAYRGLSDKTRKEWARWLDQIQEDFGAGPLSAWDHRQAIAGIRNWRERWAPTPRTADVALEVMSRLLSFGRGQGLVSGDPCKEIDRLYSANRSALIWTPADFDELERRASREIMWAARLAGLTGLRRGDLLRLSWSHIKTNSVEISTGKSKHRKTTLIPVYGELRALLEEIPKRATTVLTNTAGQPWGSGFSASWNKAKGANPAKGRLAIPLHFHDLRGTAATKFFVAGLTIRQIAEIMTWSEDRIEALINRYVKRDELILAMIRQMDSNGAGTPTVKPDVKQV